MKTSKHSFCRQNGLPAFPLNQAMSMRFKNFNTKFQQSSCHVYSSPPWDPHAHRKEKTTEYSIFQYHSLIFQKRGYKTYMIVKIQSKAVTEDNNKYSDCRSRLYLPLQKLQDMFTLPIVDSVIETKKKKKWHKFVETLFSHKEYK